ncbi:MAG TPA: DUF6152 family protein [Terriglobia bacterium]|nr:DUF6152 family protein [Terriglobia bacterium]
MRSKLFPLVLVALMGLPASAHHPFSAEYDWKQPVTITGTVSKLDWANPHAHLFVDAKDTEGKTKAWSLELGGLNALTTAGWSKTTLKMGDTVVIDAWLSKSQPNLGNVKSVKLPDGRELSGASSIADPNAREAGEPKGKA